MDWFLYNNGLRHERVNQISNLIFPNERISRNRPVLADERLTLPLRNLATGESFQSLKCQNPFHRKRDVVVPSIIA